MIRISQFLHVTKCAVIGGAENAGVENAGVHKVWKAVRIKYSVDLVWLPQFPRVPTNNLEHTPRRIREAQTLWEQFKRKLNNWPLECAYDRRHV